MNLGKILLGVGTVACAPIAVAGVAGITATVGAVAVICGGASEAVVIGGGVLTMGVVDKTTKLIGTKIIEEGLME